MMRTHGGDWQSFSIERGRLPLDFSANISPLGVPSGVQAAIAEAAKSVDLYPDPRCRSLRAALSQHHKLPADDILCGNGASDLIYRFMAATQPKQALLIAPSFSEYASALEAVGCLVTYYHLKKEADFALTEDYLPHITPSIDLVILCEPNNPTGLATDPALLRNILHRCETLGIWLFVDECFLAFLEDPERQTFMPYLKQVPKLLILKAFTKLYGMAGVRLGYALSSNTGLLDSMQSVGPPWSVSSLAQAAGCAALQETDYVKSVRTLLFTERKKLQKRLEGLGLRVIAGQANFLLFQCFQPLDQELASKGILLRACDDFQGLNASWYRIAIRTEEENERLIQALGEVIG